WDHGLVLSPPQEPLQEWGEEVEDGAIYSVILQRVRAEPAASEGSCGAPSCPFIQYRTCKLRRLRAGTLAKLVSGLVCAETESDPGYVPSFLATYRTFGVHLGDPWGVTEIPPPDRAVLRVLELWLHDHPEDFRDPPQHPSLRQLHGYLCQAAPGSEGCRWAEGLLQSFQDQPGGEQVEPEGERPQLSPPLRLSSGYTPCLPGPESSGEPPDLLSFSVEEVAEQLTLMDVELFVRVQPFQCLGCVWSHRDRKGGRRAAPSVRATVAQFNAITGCVIASVLGDLQIHVPQRARRLEKWVAIAQHCWFLRNFSSLRAVLSALQSSPVHRLKRTWAAVSRDTMGIFQKLSQIFSDDQHHLSSREILQVREGSPGAGAVLPAPQARPPGTVPYLGTFLTDLIMLDTALPDFLEGGLINFEKRRKEADILQQIRQLQASCGDYALRPNAPVLAAFQHHDHLSEEQSYRISRLIEPPADSCPNSPCVRRSLSKRFSAVELAAGGGGWGCWGAVLSCSPFQSSPPIVAHSPPSPPGSCWGPRPCPPGCPLPRAASHPQLPLSACPPEEPLSPLARPPRSPLCSQEGTDSRVVRVSVDNAHGNLYKSILLTSQDKTPAVVLRALQKHGLEGPPPGDFQLLQRLGDGRELLIPDGANAFYAMNPAAAFDFVLRRRGPQAPPSPHPPRSPRSPPPWPPSPALLPEPLLPLPSAPSHPPS
uniref:Ral guanine nucleotide dissociation stimulator like 3 n=1 Tax=Pelusios castaneus TaxID=367368 RepID=A0A8C8SSJ1_9SAUR